ncbi:MAG TPA: hypothetical protein VFV50_09495 [Bdellovibrionales bacterium]|nr:hypothetical protein [Bdellovibrionales bacterium]
MPILDVEIVGELSVSEPAQALADAAGTVLKTRVGGTWVKLRRLDPGDYAENGPNTPQPVFVNILASKSFDQSEFERVAQELAAAFAAVLRRPIENIHVLLEPSAKGRIAFGGSLVK